jgi:hypothetical protein
MKVWLGFDPREADAYMVARHSVWKHSGWQAHGLVLSELQDMGLYKRPVEYRVTSDGRRVMFDTLSDAAMSTQHANARFLVPYLAKEGWAMFADCDILVRAPLYDLIEQLDPAKAVMCVQHDYTPAETVKMDGQTQASYGRKNWSSVMVFNCDHPANKRLTLEEVNTRAGRDLHRFCWLQDDEIGALGPEWNYLVGVSPKVEPKIAHFTLGLPSMPGYENCEYADEWRNALTEAAL